MTEGTHHARWEKVKRVGISILFTAVLVIPRIRRLRRRNRVWTGVRLTAVAAGASLAWWSLRSGGDVLYLVVGLGFLAFGLAVRAQVQAQSEDELARKLDAWVVLNGGTFLPTPDGPVIPGVRLFVNPEHLFVVDSHDQLRLKIPAAQVRQMVAQPLPSGAAPPGTGEPWQLELAWESAGLQKGLFRFEGFFAEHLANVVRMTVQRLLQRSLPVLKN